MMEKLDYLATPTWLPYVVAGDMEATARRAEELGANIAVPPSHVVDYGLFCVMADPAGALLGISRPD